MGFKIGFTPNFLGMNERDQESFTFFLAELFQIMLLPRRPRPMTPQVMFKDSFGRSGWGLQGIICNI